MMEIIYTNFSQILSTNIYFALFLALIAGIVSSFSPCVLSSLPLIIGYINGFDDNNKKRAFGYSLFFCIGLVIMLTSLGALSAILGKLFAGTGSWWYIFLSILMIIVSLDLLGIINIIPKYCKIPSISKGITGAFFLGILGGIFSSPCSTPVLAVILAFVASKGNLLFGILLLLIYSIGHCTLIIIAGTSVGFIQKLSSSERTQKAGNVLKILLGIIILLLGLYLFYVGI